MQDIWNDVNHRYFIEDTPGEMTMYNQNDSRKLYFSERIIKTMNTLKQALELAMCDKIYMPFVENCETIKPLLLEIERQGNFRDDISTILQLNEGYQRSLELISKTYFLETKSKLTEREMEIAQLAS